MRLLLLSLSITSLLYSCKKDNKVPLTQVPAWLKQMVPYQPGQVIRFDNGTGGIISATVEKTTLISEQSGCAGCPVSKRVEYFEYYIKAGSNRFIELIIDYRPVVFLRIWSPADNYQVGSGLDFQVIDGQTQFDCNGPRQSCLPSITLNGTTFNDVLETRNTGSPNIVKAYYTIAQGVVGFAYANGATYSKVP